MQLYYNPIRMDAGIWWPLPGSIPEHRLPVRSPLASIVARLGEAALERSGGQAAYSAQSSRAPRRYSGFHPHHTYLRKLVRTPPQDELTGREVTPGTEIETDEQIEALCARDGADHVSPGRHMHDGHRRGSGGRSGIARARHCKFACDRCFDHADSAWRQHECTIDDDR